MIIMILNIYEAKFMDNIALVIEYATMFTFAINSDIKFVTSLRLGAIRRLNENLKAIYPQQTIERIEYLVNEFYWPRPLLIMIIFYFVSTAMVLVGPFFQSVFMYFYYPGIEFPYLHYYPFFHFDPQHHTAWHYLGIYLIEWLHASHMIVSNMSTDLWLVCFQIQICMHFSYINRSFSNFEPHSENDLQDRQFMAELITKHNILTELQNDLNGIYGSSLLFTMVTTASLFCTAAVNIQIQGFSLEGVTLLMFMVNTLSTDIAFSAYSHNWSDASLSYRKYLLIIAIRAQQPIELSAMGYMPMSHDTFKLVMTVSYRLFALLRQMIQ
ncbi:odorant receptor 85f-like [Drosophila willistoni]|uniref:odorant receptor 85f-like n=1 Tax=Drosophila willistoni TaxID=7260 RepID=UPI001F0878EB|nr:odorant receptor 85f-like [Drosophila willistoni]XP_046869652.1 odorant receptor 85f-like [Drosophila willistoni]